MNKRKKPSVLSLGTAYIDINCINFPFDKGLFAHRETTGNEYLMELGGSSLNFAKICTKLDIKTMFLGKVGDDRLGNMAIKMMREQRIIPHVMLERKAHTNLAVHYIHEDGTSIMTSTGSANQQLTKDNVTLLLSDDEYTFDYLYLGGCFKLKELLPDLYKIAKEQKAKGAIIVLDHGRINNSVTEADLMHIKKLLPYVDLYLPSIDEFLAVWDAQTIDEAYAKASQVTKATIVVKQGDLGATGFVDGKKIDIPAYKVKVINTVGAGDSFNAGLIRALSQKLPYEEAIRHACATAAVKISDKPFNYDEIRNLLKK